MSLNLCSFRTFFLTFRWWGGPLPTPTLSPSRPPLSRFRREYRRRRRRLRPGRVGGCGESGGGDSGGGDSVC